MLYAAVNQRIEVIGIGADGPTGLRPDLVERIERADFLAGGDRHLRLFPLATGERFLLRDNVNGLLEEVARRHAAQQCVVLASGDPLFYGIGVALSARFDSATLRFEPALSSMQLAFARAGLPWQNARLASVHGRGLRETLLPLLGQPLIGLFTQDGHTPAAVARFLLRFGLGDYQVVVAENLGTAEERVTHWPELQAVLTETFAPLNYLILERSGRAESLWLEVAPRRALVPGAPDEAFARPTEKPEVMTRQEVRSVILGKLLGYLDPGDLLWDIGSGLGTIAVECAVLKPHVEVVAVERDPARLELLRENRRRFGAYNMRVLPGTAPEILKGEVEPPRRIFLGGSGGHLPALLDLIRERLAGGGRLVASFVTLEHLTEALDAIRRWHWPVEITELHVSRSDPLAGLTGLRPQRGVFLLGADKPGVAGG
jgi:precorrin-6Y C5,15-methyltransferase (decarboxylating)